MARVQITCYDAMCGLTLLLVLSFAPRVFCLGMDDEDPLCSCATSKTLFCLFIYLFTHPVCLQFAMVECVVTGLSDEYPKYLRRYKPVFLISVCVLMFLLAIPMCSQVGFVNYCL